MARAGHGRPVRTPKECAQGAHTSPAWAGGGAMPAGGFDRRRLWPALLAAAVASALIAPAVAVAKAPASGIKNYKASMSAATVEQGATVDVVLYNCGVCPPAAASNQAF